MTSCPCSGLLPQDLRTATSESSMPSATTGIKCSYSQGNFEIYTENPHLKDDEAAWPISRAMQIILVIVAGLGFMADALEISLMSFLGTSIEAEWNLPKKSIASLGVAVFAGEIVGCVFWGPASDYYGRKKSYLASCLIMTIASMLSALAPNFTTLVAARAVVGFGE